MSKTNTVLTIPEPGKVELEERPYPKIVSGYALVKVAVAPVCIEHQVYKEHLFKAFEDGHNLGHDTRIKYRDGLVRMLNTPAVKEMLDVLITHEYNMSQGAEAFETCLTKKAGKVFLYPQEDCPNPGPTAA